MARKRYLIIGDGAAGLAAAQTLRSASSSARITVVSDDPHPGYFRAALTNYLLGELREDQLWAVPPDFYQNARISRVHCRVVGLDTDKAEVWEASGSAPIGYDALLIASGARPRTADFPGAHLPGIHTMRTIVDVRRIADLLASRSVGSAVVLGGGPLGLEWAHGLHERGVQVHLLERGTRLMGNVLDDVCSDLLASRLRSAGIHVYLGEQVAHAAPNQLGSVGAITTQAGRTLQCDMIAVAFGVQPNTEFLSSSKVAVDAQRRVCTDQSMLTSVKNVWAAGDVASVNGQSFGLWEPAKRQASIAAQNMLGGRATFSMSPHYLATRLFDLDFASVGEVQACRDCEVLVDFPPGTGSICYRKLLLREGRLVGAQMLGQRSTRARRNGRALLRLIQSGADVSSIKLKLLTEEFDVGGWLETRRLFQRPKQPARERKLMTLAKLKGTQALDFGSMPWAKSQSAQAETKVLPSRQTRMLSIGLLAEAPAPAMAAAGLDGRLNYQGREWPITQAVTRLGSAPDADFRLPNIGSLHAEITRHGQRLYLRDAGSRSGTWVNQQVLTVPHPLVDGDQIQIERHLLIFRSTELVRTALPPRAGLGALGLQVQGGKSLGLSFALGQAPVLVGSGAHCQLRLTEPSVAHEHARITAHQGQHYLADLASPAGTRVNGSVLPPHQNVALLEGSVFSVGAVEIRYGVRPLAATTLFETTARLIVDQGAERGCNYILGERCLVGTAENCDFRLSGLAPQHVEITRQGLDFFVRDSSAGSGSFRSGMPLGPNFVPLNSGDVLLLGNQVMLRFEEDI